MKSPPPPPPPPPMPPAKGKRKITKLEIRAFKDSDYTGFIGKYVFVFNPATFKDDNSVVFVKKGTPMGANGRSAKFNKAGPKKLHFQFILDGTGALGNVEDVSTQIKKLKDLAFAYNGDIHEPNYLKLYKGKLLFEGRLEKLNVNYTLFDYDGKPLRGMVSVGFVEHVDAARLALKARKNSPDLTHLRTVKAGDTLPLMCHKIYGDSKYYLEVAKVNNLMSFRSIEPGLKIYFPPITIE